jgi:hypothetical protein
MKIRGRHIGAAIGVLVVIVQVASGGIVHEGLPMVEVVGRLFGATIFSVGVCGFIGYFLEK